MRGPTESMEAKATGIEIVMARAVDKLLEHVKLFLARDMEGDDAKRDKDYLRDSFILPRMKRLRRKTVMISDTEGVRRDEFLQLSQNKKKAKEQVERLRRLAARLDDAPEPVIEEVVTIYSLSPQFTQWLKKHPEEERKFLKVAGVERLCPIREEKEHKGEIRAQCER